MREMIICEGVYFLRLVLACICGGIIGYERKNRGKGAGIRTHIIVALASALMMLVSKYGFSDIAPGIEGARGADNSRIAAQVVSGVGFLGAGMIYFNRHSVKGLTTAAGIWATSGVGLAIGAGMYAMGISTSILIVVIQIILHKNLKFLHMPNEEEISVTIEDTPDARNFINTILKEHNITVDSFKCARRDGLLDMTLVANFPSDFNVENMMALFQNNACIKSIDI